MSSLTLFHDPTSEPSRAVHWFALEAGIELELRLTWLTRGEHRSAEFLRVNPAHQVPALKHGEFCLPEAAAIMLYLAGLAGCTNSWVGTTERERAYTNRFMSWHHSNTRKTVTLDYLLPVLLMPAYKGDPAPAPGEIERLKENIRASLAMLEGFLTRQGQYLGGKNPSLADIFIAADLFALDADSVREELINPDSDVGRWLDRLRARDAYVVSHAAWNTLVPHIQKRLEFSGQTAGEPAWVADVCMTGSTG